MIVVAVLVAGLLLRGGCRLLELNRAADPVAAMREGACEVVRVVDGDTILVRQQVDSPSSVSSGLRDHVRVRLLGIDTPETVKEGHPVERWGPEATEFTQRFLAGGRAQLRFDKRRVDRYGRLLAYVYVDDRMLNEELVRAGLARVSLYPGDSESIGRQLRRAEEAARREKIGIWGTHLGIVEPSAGNL